MRFPASSASVLLRSTLCAMAVCAALTMAHGQTADGPLQQAGPVSIAPAVPVGAGDLLEVTVFDTPELSGKYRVNEKGELALPVGGSLPVAGLTAEQVAAAVAQRLRAADVMYNPHVGVMVLEYATQGASVLGAVNKPGVYPLHGSQGLFDVISAAGGLTEAAGSEVTITHKNDPSNPVRVKLASTNPTAESNVQILPGDTVVVSRAGIVYVVGAVGRPGGFLLKADNDQQLTVLQALALAQGATSNASLNSASLIRTTAKGREQIPISLKRILANKAPDPELQENDILFIPTSGMKNAAFKGLDTAIRIATGVAIYTR